MNICILMGKIVSEIEFKFIIKSKHKSIAYFDMELVNKSIIRIKAYDYMADYVYRKYKANPVITVEGKIRGDGMVEIYKKQKNFTNFFSTSNI